MVQVAEHLSSKHEALSSNPREERRKGGREREFRKEGNGTIVWQIKDVTNFDTFPSH
jgi:hypothetical protein